jgi:TonB-dependent starch-binding outer membrane protein SusC
MKIKYTSLLKTVTMVMFFTLISCAAWAQRTISGTITDAGNDEPLVGATVILTGTNKGTLTDIDGKFELMVPENASTIDVSYTGYSSQKVDLGASNVVDVKMASGRNLDEVIVVGYGTLKAKEITSAVVSVSSKDFNKGNISDPLQLLQGKVAGLSIAKPGGNPNQDFILRLRGISTLSANVSPLIVVDGIQDVPLNAVDPSDIESIDVLKDGSASAIYGTRGSAGVIIINTKKGRPGETKFNYNAQVSTESLARTPAVMTAAEFKANGGADLGKNGSSTDWYKEITRTGLSNFHNLSMSGGTAKTTYFGSFNYRNVQGVAFNDGYKQIIGRFNVSQKILNDKIKITFDASIGSRDFANGFGEAFRYASTHNPTAPILDANATKYGGYAQNTQFDDFNPVGIVKQSINEGTAKQVQFTGRAEYSITDNLSLSSSYSVGNRSIFAGEYYSRLGYFRGTNRNGLASQFNNNARRDLFNTLLTWKETSGKIDYSITGGYEYLNRTFSFNAIEAGGFSTDAPGYSGISNATDLYTGGQAAFGSGKNNDKTISFLGRANVSYDDTYFFNASLRNDGSTQFSEGQRRGSFFSAGAAVAINKVANLSNFDVLKFRIGYGQTGALPVNSYSDPLFGINSRNGGTVFVQNGANIKWENKGELNVGLDWAKGRFDGSLDYFNRNITDLLFFFPNTPAGIFELQGVWANAGNLKVSGLELSLGYQVLKSADKNGLNWKTQVNFSTAKSTLGKIGTADFTATELKRSNVGAPGLNGIPIIYATQDQPIGQIWTYRDAGPDASGAILGFAKTGEKKLLKDLTDDDKVVVGNGLPTGIFGFNNTFSKGAWDFNFFIRGAIGHSLVNEYRLFYENNGGGGSYNRIKTKNWDPARKEAQFTDRYVEKADFLRLDNFTLGYTIPTANTSFKSIRLFLSGNNLLTLTSYTGVDPEVKYIDEGSSDNANRATGSDPLAPGIDRRTNYFSTRAFSVGIGFGF